MNKDVMSAGRACRQFLLFFSVLLLFGCQTLVDSGVVQKPTAALSDLSVRSLSPEGVLFDAVLKIENPNPIALTLSSFNYDMQVAGKSLVSGQQSAQTQVAAAGASEVRVPLRLKFADLKSIGGSVSKQKQISYALKTTAFIDLPVLGPLAFPAEKTGEVPLPRVPTVGLSRIEVKSVGLSGADLSVKLRVNNPNAFGIDVSHLKSALKVDGVSWMDATLSKALTISAERSQQVDLPIRLDFLKLGTQLMRQLQSREPLQYELAGSFTLGTDLPLLQRLSMPYQVSGEVPLR